MKSENRSLNISPSALKAEETCKKLSRNRAQTASFQKTTISK